MPGTPSPLERFPPTLLGRSRVSGPPALLKLLDAIIASLGDGRTSAGPRGFCKTSCSKSGAHAEVKHGEESCPHRPRSCNVLRAPARRMEMSKNVGGRARQRTASTQSFLLCLVAVFAIRPRLSTRAVSTRSGLVPQTRGR